MAEGFELYHIPQQSRREKLRVVLQNHHTTACLGDTTALGLLPFYDQSPFISSSQKLLPCTNAKSSLMANNNGSNASDYRTESLGLQSVHDLVYRHQDLRFIQHHDHAPYRGGDFVALSLSSQNTGVNLQSYGGGGSGGDFGRSVVMPLGPYTGYASILKGSKFLKPAQEVLDECDVGFGIYAEKFAVDYGLMTDSPPLENLRTSVDDRVDKRKSSRLIFLLEEVYKRYKQYYQQMQEVIASFETVAGVSSAAPFANLGVKAMSKHFHSLKNAITEQLQFSVKPHEHHISYKNKEFMWSAVDNMQFVDHQQPLWRPQRGLPKRAVTVLRSWLFDHFLHPYPTDTDKQLLAKQTGLSRNQVSNWFINARVRLWKPMVEEVHTLEKKQVNNISSHIQQQDTSSSLGKSLHPMNQKPPSKRTRNDGKYNHQHIMEGNKEFYENLSIQSGSSRASANVGQNRNVFTLSEPFPVNDGGRERCVVGGLYAQNRQ